MKSILPYFFALHKVSDDFIKKGWWREKSPKHLAVHVDSRITWNYSRRCAWNLPSGERQAEKRTCGQFASRVTTCCNLGRGKLNKALLCCSLQTGELQNNIIQYSASLVDCSAHPYSMLRSPSMLLPEIRLTGKILRGFALLQFPWVNDSEFRPESPPILNSTYFVGKSSRSGLPVTRLARYWRQHILQMEYAASHIK